MNLSRSEEKHLLRLEKYVKRIYINYIAVGLSFCTAIAGLIIGSTSGRKEAFLITLIFGAIGVNLFLLSRSYQRFFVIVSKLKQNIEELEKGDRK